MDTQYHDESLRQLFRQLPVEKPSVNFSSRVMEKVMIEAQHARKRQRIRTAIWYVAVSCMGVVLLVTGLYFANSYFDIVGYLNKPGSFPVILKNSMSAVNHLLARMVENKAMLAGVALLSLLLGDLFFRRLHFKH